MTLNTRLRVRAWAIVLMAIALALFSWGVMGTDWIALLSLSLAIVCTEILLSLVLCPNDPFRPKDLLYVITRSMRMS